MRVLFDLEEAMTTDSKPTSVPDLTNPVWFAIMYAAEEGMGADDVVAAQDEFNRLQGLEEQLEAKERERIDWESTARVESDHAEELREQLQSEVALKDGLEEEVARLAEQLEAAQREKERYREWVQRIWVGAEQEMWDEAHGPDSWQLEIKRAYRERAEKAEARLEALIEGTASLVKRNEEAHALIESMAACDCGHATVCPFNPVGAEKWLDYTVHWDEHGRIQPGDVNTSARPRGGSTNQTWNDPNPASEPKP